MAARSIQQWFDAYGESHRNPTNKLIHWICVPTIYFCVVALLWSIPAWPSTPWLPSGWAAMAAVLLVALFYLRLSIPIMFGMALFSGLCLLLSAWLDTHADRPLWSIALVLFVAVDRVCDSSQLESLGNIFRYPTSCEVRFCLFA